MIPVLFINCDSSRYVSQIIEGSKRYETRNRRMLDQLIGKWVLIAESGKGRKPMVRAKAYIGHNVIRIESADDWEWFRSSHRVPVGGVHDWKPDTKVKYLYELLHAEPVGMFIPRLGERHGRVWAELDEKNLPSWFKMH